jgi:hypothetical protein
MAYRMPHLALSLVTLGLGVGCSGSGGGGATTDSGSTGTDSAASTSGGTTSASGGSVSASGSGSSGAGTSSGSGGSGGTGSGSTTSGGSSGSTGGGQCGDVPAEDLRTYLGGDDFEHARDVAYDCEGNLYVAGGTRSADFPSTLGGAAGDVDVFVARYAPSGALLWARRFGSPNYDRAYALEVDGAGDVVVAGRAGDGFPTTNGVLQPSFAGDLDAAGAYGNQDGFVAKLDADGNLLWATYFGGPGRDFIRDIAVDGSGDVYIAASQVTRDHPHVSPGSFDATRSGMDCVAAKLSGDGTTVSWGGYLGGSGDDGPEPSIRVDRASGAAVMVISSDAADLPATMSAYQATPSGSWDLFVARIAPDGASLEWATYFGGTAGDGLETHNLALAADGRVVLGFGSTSTDLPTTAGALQSAYAGTGGAGQGTNTNYPGDGYVGILSADGGSLLAGTYLGGTAGDAVEGVAIATDGRIYASGGTFSAGFPTAGNPAQATHGGDLDGFLAVLSADLGALDYSTFVGGSDWDVLRAVEIGGDGSISGVGESRSTNLPTTPNAPSSIFGGGSEWDAIVARLAVP